MDPFEQFKSDLEASLTDLFSLLSTSNSSPSSPFSQSRIPTLLSSIQSDITDLDQTVLALEHPIEGFTLRQKIGISENEVKERRAFIERAREEVGRAMRMSGIREDSIMGGGKGFTSGERYTDRVPSSSPYNNLSNSDQDDYPNSHPSNDSYTNQLLLSHQETTLTSIASSIQSLLSQAHSISSEVDDHHRLLNSMDEDIDRTSTRLRGAQGRMDRMSRAIREGGANCVIIILIAVLCILLLIIVVT